MKRRVVTLKFTDVSEFLSASIIRTMMEAVRISETSMNFNVTHGATVHKTVNFRVS
jgi:hypothetical protein